MPAECNETDSSIFSEARPIKEATGVIVGQKQELVVVRLADNSEALCRIRRRQAIFKLPLGAWVLIRYPEKETSTPLIIKFLEDETASGLDFCLLVGTPGN